MAAAVASSNSTDIKCNNCIRSYQLKGYKGSSGRRPPLLPLLLTCGHTFCSQCIPKFSPPSTSSIRCPMCQAIAPYNPQVDSAKQIPPNLHLVGLLYCKQHSLPSVASESAAGKVILDPDLWTKLTPVPPSPGALDDLTKPCEECRKLTRHKCRQCSVPLCKECFRLTHSAAVFLRKHELIAVLSSTFSTCPLHELPMDRFCSSDHVTFCSECAPSHTGHNVTLIDEKSDELHDRLKPLLDSARKVLRSMKRSHATVSDEGLAALKEQLFQLMGQVEQHFLLLHTALQARCLQLMNSLAQAAESQAADLQTICHKLKDGIGRLTDTMTYVQEVSEDSSQLVQCGDRIMTELNILLELPCSLHSAEKEPLRCHLDDSVYETLKDYGTVVPPAKAWYAIGNVMVDSDNDTPRSMSDAENDRAEPNNSEVDGIGEAVGSIGLEGAEAEGVGEVPEKESSEGPGSVTMESSPTHSAMDTTLREESGGEEDDSEGDSLMGVDTSVPKENLGKINPSGTPTVRTQRQEGGLLSLPESQEGQRHLSPLFISLTESHPQGGSSVNQSSPGGTVHKGKTVERSSLKGVPSSGARGNGPSTSLPPWQGADGGVEKGGAEVEMAEDEDSQVPQKGDHEDSLVQVVHVDNPGKFFVRYKREVSQFDRMMTQLNAEQQAKVKMRAKEISLGTLCASSYSGGEGRLFRAEISSLPAKAFPFYTVKYIDLGDMESVKLERLYHLPPNMASALPFAHRCKLARIGPVQMPGKYPLVDVPVAWGDRAILNFKTQLSGRELKMEVVSCETEGLVVDLHMLMVTEWVSIAERLINKGLAQWEKSAEEEEEEEEQRDLPVQEIPLGETLLDCVVCEARSPSNFYIQVMGNNVLELQDLMNILQQEALVSQRVTRPSRGMLCMGLFTDGQWYRASIEDVCDGSDEVTVRYVDFGNTERVPVEHLKQINTSLLNLPSQAIPCALAGVLPVGDGGDWSEEACHVFSSLLTNTRIQAEVQENGREPEGVLHLNITDPPIADNLVAEKLAVFTGPIAFPPATLPQSGDVCRGFVVYIDTPFLFYFRKYDPISDQTLESVLQQVSPPPSSRVSTWSRGDCCCTHFNGDANWHRALVTEQTQTESEYKVYYVDYGNIAVVKAEDMVPVLHPDLLAIPQKALCCRLANIAPLEEEWSRGACVFLSTAVVNQLVVVEIKDVDLRETAPLSVEICLPFSEAYGSGPTRMTESLIANGYALSTNILHLHPYDGPSYRPHPLPDDNPFKMMVICVQNDGQVVGQLEESQAELEALMEKVQVACSKNKKWLGGLSELRRGQPCCAKFSEDNLWYRTVVDDIVNGKALVCYVDFGNCEEVSVDCIVPKPVCMDVPVKSICLQLAQTESLTWNESVAQVLTEIVSDKQCTVHLKEPFEVAGSSYGSLQLDTGEDVVELLMEQLRK